MLGHEMTCLTSFVEEGLGVENQARAPPRRHVAQHFFKDFAHKTRRQKSIISLIIVPS